MIALDNTPARGDYVRYIDDLMKRAALAAPAVVSSDGDMASDVDALIRERTNAASTGTGAANEWTPTAPSVSRRTRPPVPSSSGFTTPTVASPAAAAASAIAAALMSGQVGRGSVLSGRALLAVAAIVVAVVLIVAGVLVQPFNAAFVVGGAALIAWAVRGMKAVVRKGGRTRSA